MQFAVVEAEHLALSERPAFEPFPLPVEQLAELLAESVAQIPVGTGSRP